MSLFFAAIRLVLLCTAATADTTPTFPCQRIEECKQLSLWHIPGPNPIVSPYKNTFATDECEDAGGVRSTYVFIYHCVGDKNYRVGMSATIFGNPLGPYRKPSKVPNLSTSPTPAWDKDVVASFHIMRNPDQSYGYKWLGYYEGGMLPGGKAGACDLLMQTIHLDIGKNYQ